jgi:glycosyltransferase involved in cell wall biosynthesis
MISTERGAPSSVAQISVVVPCRDEAEYIRQFVSSLEDQQLGGLRWEVIIADGASSDGTRQILDELAARRPWLRVINNPEKVASSGLNAAIAAAAGSVIVRMDVHTEYAPDYVRRCLETLERTGADNVGGPWQAKGANYIGKAIAAVFNSPFAAGGALSRRRDYEGPVDTVFLGCWRRELFRGIGGFDPQLVRNQDDELNFRIIRSGGVVWQSPRIVSWYHSRPDLGGLSRQYLQYGFWKLAVIRKHGKPASWRHLVPGTFVLANLMLASGTLAGWIAGNETLFSGSLALWSFMVAAYLAVTLAASLRLAKREGFRYLPVLPLVLATCQISYGVGFLLAMLRFSPGHRTGNGLFSAITR